MIPKYLTDGLEKARKQVSEAQKKLKQAHENIAEYEANMLGLYKDYSYYVTVENLELKRKQTPVGTRLEVYGFQRFKVYHDEYRTMVMYISDGKKDTIDIEIFLHIIGKKEDWI